MVTELKNKINQLTSDPVFVIMIQPEDESNNTLSYHFQLLVGEKDDGKISLCIPLTDILEENVKPKEINSEQIYEYYKIGPITALVIYTLLKELKDKGRSVIGDREFIIHNNKTLSLEIINKEIDSSETFCSIENLYLEIIFIIMKSLGTNLFGIYNIHSKKIMRYF